MTPFAYYNEFDEETAMWLRMLIKKGVIAPGIVDERSIVDVQPDDLREFTQCHFFAGVGVWSYALRRAGWPDDRRVWTGSCPCQPFSSAGKGGGFADERHLWPHWFHLITTAKSEPVPVFGEQVASKDGLAWLDLVQTDMEGAGYAFGAVDLCAAGVGAPHIRQRLFFVAERMADPASDGRYKQKYTGAVVRKTGKKSEYESGIVSDNAMRGCTDGGMADADQQQRDGSRDARAAGRGELADDGTVGGMANTEAATWNRAELRGDEIGNGGITNQRNRDTSPTNGLWRDADWLFCRDGKWRPVEPGTFPLAHGAPARVGRLRGYGNAINAEVAATFIRAAIESGVR